MLGTRIYNGSNAVFQHKNSRIRGEESQTIAASAGTASAVLTPSSPQGFAPHGGDGFFIPSHFPGCGCGCGPGVKESALKQSRAVGAPRAVVVKTVLSLQTAGFQAGAEAPTSLDTNGTSDDFCGSKAKPIGEAVNRRLSLTLSGQKAAKPKREASKPLVCINPQYIKLLCTSCGNHYRVITQTCGKRFQCEMCRKLWMSDSVKRFKPVLLAMAEIVRLDLLKQKPKGERLQMRMITLTVKNGPDLAERLKHLEKSFHKLKQRNLWKDNVEGGLRVLELTKDKDGNWHPHYHIVIVSRYIKHSDLKKAWKKITGDSEIVDIRLVRFDAVNSLSVHDSIVKTAKELFKYTLKDSKSLTDDDKSHVAALLKGKRLVVTLGKEYKRYECEPEPKPVPCEACGDSSPRWMIVAMQSTPFLADSPAVDALDYVLAFRDAPAVSGLPKSFIGSRPPPEEKKLFEQIE